MPGINSNEPSVTLAIRMRLGETEEIFQLPVTQEMISRLMFEAHVREINVAELLAELITAKSVNRFRTASGRHPLPARNREGGFPNRSFIDDLLARHAFGEKAANYRAFCLRSTSRPGPPLA